MKNLLKIGLSSEIIEEMIENNGIYLVTDLNDNYLDAYKIINTLEQIKISKDTINLLLINLIQLFFMDYNKFLEKLRDKDLTDISDRINSDFEEAYDIFLKE